MYVCRRCILLITSLEGGEALVSIDGGALGGEGDGGGGGGWQSYAPRNYALFIRVYRTCIDLALRLYVCLYVFSFLSVCFLISWPGSEAVNVVADWFLRRYF